MSGKFADDFGWYTRAQAPRHWTILAENGAISVGPFGRNGGPGIQFSGDIDDAIYLDLTALGLAPAGATAIQEIDINVSALPSVDTPFLAFTEGGAVQVQLWLETDGKLSAYTASGSPFALLGTTASAVVTAGAWVRIGGKVLIDGAAGTVDVQKQGPGDTAPVSVLALTGEDTQAVASSPAGWDGIILYAATAAITSYANLFVKDGSSGVSPGVNDDLSTSPQNVVATVRAVADGAHSEFSRSTGLVQYAGIDDVTADDDSSYNESPSNNQIDTFAMGDTPDPNQAIAFVMLAAVARNGGGTEELAAVMRQGSTDYVGTSHALAQSYAHIFEPYDDAPDGSSWTPTIWNAMEAGYKRTT